MLEKIVEKNNWSDLAKLDQIAIVTGLFDSEKETVRFIRLVRKVSAELNFNGQIFFLGSELRSREALKELSDIAPFSFCYAIDCFNKRNEYLGKRKADYSLDDIYKTLRCSLNLGYETTYGYILGLDHMNSIEFNVSRFLGVINRFPIFNIYQMQHKLQRKLLDEEANELKYFLRARRLIEKIFRETNMRPHNWENYRSLWTNYFLKERILI